MDQPTRGQVKLNIHAAFSLERGLGGSGAVNRDDQGNFIVASSSSIAHVFDAATAESTTLQNGFILAGQVGCARVVVNCYCMDVI